MIMVIKWLLLLVLVINGASEDQKVCRNGAGRVELGVCLCRKS